MLNRIPYDWVIDAASNVYAENRFYLDPRGLEYPPLSGTPAYLANDGYDNMPGQYWLTSSLVYLISPGTSFSGEIFFKQATIGTDAELLKFSGGYSLTLKRLAAGGYSLVSVGGSTVTSSGGTTQPIQRVGFTFTYGGAQKLYIDGVLIDSDTAPALTINPVYLTINAGLQHITHVRLFNNYAASDTDHQNNFKTVKHEEIFFSFNKTAYGRTRCNITPCKCVTGYGVENRLGYKSANASLYLINKDGMFSDDQYAIYAPESESYNGLVTQKYLTRRVGYELETWAPESGGLYPSGTLYPADNLYPSGCYYTYEPLFRGYIPQGSFNRYTRVGDKSTVSVSADDGIAQIARKIVRRARSAQNYYLSRETPSSNSAVHFIAELATKHEVYNYLTNSSFENATIGDSWATTGTLARDTTAVLAGSYCGKFSGTDKTISQTAIFSDLTKGETFTGSIWIYSISAITGAISLSDMLSSTVNGTSSYGWSHAGKGWQEVYVSHEVVLSSSDRIRMTVLFDGTVSNVPVDCAMLKYGDHIPWWVLNSNSGTTYSASGVSAIGSEMLGSYDWIGIAAEDVSYQHPWIQAKPGDKVWELLKNMGDAILARGIWLDEANVMRIPSMFGDGLPSSLGSLDMPASLVSGQQDTIANKIKVQGVQIVTYTKDQVLWLAESANIEPDSGASIFVRTIANGAQFPDSSIEGVTEYEALYDSSDTDIDVKKYESISNLGILSHPLDGITLHLNFSSML